MKTLILNSSNIVENTNNSRLVYRFPRGGFTIKDEFIAIQEISMYYSTYNISSGYGNNTLSYTWVDGSTVSITIPDGNYSFSELNDYLQFIFIQNSHYLITTTGSYVYLLELVVNQPRYAVQVNSYVISSTIASTNSWSLPSGASWALPTNNIVPILNITNSGFGSLIGFSTGSYPNAVISGTPPSQTQTPSYSVAQSFLSTVAPQITPASSFLVYCNLVNNRAVVPNNLLFTFTPTNVQFGGLSTYQVAELVWNKAEDGQYEEFTIEFRDQLGRQVQIQDPNILITLVLKNKYEGI
jgi:hypothetical protein